MNARTGLNSSEWTLPVTGMSCASCSGRVENKLADMEGVDKASVNLDTAQATVTGTVTLKELADAVKEAGYGVPTESGVYAVQGIGEKQRHYCS